MADLPHTVRPNPITDELKQRVGEELAQLAAFRDRELGFTGRSYISGVGSACLVTRSECAKEASLANASEAAQPTSPIITRPRGNGVART